MMSPFIRPFIMMGLVLACVSGYYNEGGEWVCTSYVAADTSAYNT